MPERARRHAHVREVSTSQDSRSGQRRLATRLGCEAASSAPLVLQIDDAGLHRHREAGHRFAGHRHAGARAQVDLPAVGRADDDLALDDAVAEAPALMRTLVAYGEDLVVAAEERDVLAV